MNAWIIPFIGHFGCLLERFDVHLWNGISYFLVMPNWPVFLPILFGQALLMTSGFLLQHFLFQLTPTRSLFLSSKELFVLLAGGSIYLSSCLSHCLCGHELSAWFLENASTYTGFFFGYLYFLYQSKR